MNCGFSKDNEENSYNVRNRPFILGKKRGWKAGMIRGRERRKALFCFCEVENRWNRILEGVREIVQFEEWDA